MRKTQSLLFLSALLIVSGLLISYTYNSSINYEEVSFFTINAQGELERPLDYREWIYVGTPVTPNDMNNGKAPFPEMHHVYIDPASYKHYKKTGAFKEGAILVKELVSIGSKAAVSGNGYFAGEFIGLEASIKSAKHFPDAPGNWAIFSFTNPGKDVLKDTSPVLPVANCVSCHEANAKDDFVFTQYYPVLTAAKGVGENIDPENAAGRMAAMKMAAMKEKMMASQWDATAPTPKDLKLDVPVEKDALFSFLKSGKYKSFKNQEKEVHPSLGPHQKLGLPVKVFINDALATSLDAGNAEHPMGSVLVKEMYTADNALSGWAVMAKTHDQTDNGNGWFWYEVTDAENDTDKIAAVGNGVVGCISCHAIGRDMVRSSYPFK